MVFCGTHRRHQYFASKLMEYANVVGVVEFGREEMLPTVPKEIDNETRALFQRHFIERDKAEKKFFHENDYGQLRKKRRLLTADSYSFNSKATIEFVRDCAPDIVFVFGTGLIGSELLDVLPKYTINLHLGLSPWYKGAATLFWPFYYLEPQMAGSTFHLVTNRIDAGAIVLQVIPDLELGDGIHDVAAKTVEKSTFQALEIIEYADNYPSLPVTEQKGNGKLFLASDFQPHHLNVIYNLYENNIVDAYLNGMLPGRSPSLITFNDA